MKNEDVFKQLRNYHARLATVINELEILEDFENADYSDILTDIGYCTVLLEQRREQLQRRVGGYELSVLYSLRWFKKVLSKSSLC